MITRKDSKLVDLEYMIPKEHKEAHEEPISQECLVLKEVCHACGRDSEEIVLLPVFHKGDDKWICPQCLKGHLGGYAQSYASPESSATAYSEEPVQQESSGPMSLFD
jgi:hypothetical protein